MRDTRFPPVLLGWSAENGHEKKPLTFRRGLFDNLISAWQG